jgi:DNA-binding response OmpR family regulator
MKKIILAKDLEGLFLGKESFLKRADIKVFTVASNDDVLRITKKEEINLIVTQLDMPGIKSEDLFGIIRKSREMQKISVIIICQDTLAQRERCKQSRANAVFTIPVDIDLLSIKMQQFLKTAPRMLYRAALAVAIEGKFKNRPVPFWTENISANGMLIKTEEPLSKEAGIFFSFFLPNGAHVSGYGEIVRVVQSETADTFYYGVKFTNVDSHAKSAIEAAINLTSRRDAHQQVN